MSTAVERAAEVLFPIIHPQAANSLATGEGVAEYDQSHVRAAQALADAGIILDGERTTGTEFGFRSSRRERVTPLRGVTPADAETLRSVSHQRTVTTIYGPWEEVSGDA